MIFSISYFFNKILVFQNLRVNQLRHSQLGTIFCCTIHFQFQIFSTKYSFFKICELIKYRHFQLGTIYCCSINPIWIQICYPPYIRMDIFRVLFLPNVLTKYSFFELRLRQIATLLVRHDLLPLYIYIYIG